MDLPFHILVNGLCCHFFAFLRAFFTGVGAFLAMIVVVLAAFFTAAAAGLGADPAELRRELRAA